ncbi:MAG: type II toxin-antitoxin system RelE/ParE family toxin [Desulfatirhabdiaceae bacterium]
MESQNGYGRPNRLVLFTIPENTIVLLHGFIKKSQKTPANDLKLAQAGLSKLKGML